MGALTKEGLLAAAGSANLPKEKIDCPELGGYVWVRGMTGTERDEFERSNYTMKRGRIEPNLENVRARLAVRCLIDDQGVRLFGNEDAKALGQLRADTLSKIYAVAQRLSNVTDEDLEELKKLSESGAGTATS